MTNHITFIELAEYELKRKPVKAKNITIKIEALTARSMIEREKKRQQHSNDCRYCKIKCSDSDIKLELC